MAGEGMDEGWIREQSAKCGCHISCEFRIGCCHFGDDFGASVDNGEQVFEIVTSLIILAAAVLECVQLGCYEGGGGHTRTVGPPGRSTSTAVEQPATERCTPTHVFAEAQRQQLVTQHRRV